LQFIWEEKIVLAMCKLILGGGTEKKQIWKYCHFFFSFYSVGLEGREMKSLR
jgi:hypothetical protein